MVRISANLGFLWLEKPLPEAIAAAAMAGFDAVECHWPYKTPPGDVKTALDAVSLSMIAINSAPGDLGAGERGLTALPGREFDARAAMDQAIAYAAKIGAPNIHVMAGLTDGPSAHATFIDNLRYGCAKAEPHRITLLIEPLNDYDNPGYFLKTTGQAAAIIVESGCDNLKLLFDCYHVQIMEGDLSRKLKALMPMIGHIQIAAVPNRDEPGNGEVNYRHIFDELDQLGYRGFVGAEYRPRTTTDAGLGWMTTLRKCL